jgi:hypothetical protein
MWTVYCPYVGNAITLDAFPPNPALSAPLPNLQKDAVRVAVNLRVARKCLSEARALARRQRAAWPGLEEEMGETLARVFDHLLKAESLLNPPS